MNDNTLLEVEDLHVHFDTENGTVEALNGVDLSINRDEVVGLIGESGCGKSVTALSIMKLLQSPPAEIVSGSIEYGGEDLLELSGEEFDDIRGEDISMIYQDPMSSLNPVLTIGKQLVEPLLAHRDISEKEARERGIEMLDAVGLADSDRLMSEHPDALSGGMRQRVVIAMALITEPDLLIADEPTTALDVTIQAQIIDLLHDLREEFGTSILFISHNLAVISEIADRMAVMYAGNVVETCDMQSLFETPLHPYTRKLIESIPKFEETADRLPVIEGTVPELIDPPEECRFASRCPQFMKGVCDQSHPELLPPDDDLKNEHEVACYLYHDEVADDPPWNELEDNQGTTTDGIKGNPK